MFPLKLIAAVKGACLVVLFLAVAWVCLKDDTQTEYDGDVYDGPGENTPIKKLIRERYAPAAVCCVFAIIETFVDISFINLVP